jgi:hypothetical protein
LWIRSQEHALAHVLKLTETLGGNVVSANAKLPTSLWPTTISLRSTGPSLWATLPAASCTWYEAKSNLERCGILFSSFSFARICGTASVRPTRLPAAGPDDSDSPPPSRQPRSVCACSISWLYSFISVLFSTYFSLCLFVLLVPC